MSPEFQVKSWCDNILLDGIKHRFYTPFLPNLDSRSKRLKISWRVKGIETISHVRIQIQSKTKDHIKKCFIGLIRSDWLKIIRHYFSEK